MCLVCLCGKIFLYINKIYYYKMKILMFIMGMAVTITAISQNSFKAIILDGKTKQPIAGAVATIPSIKKGAVADSTGLVVINKIPNGNFEVEISAVGHQRSEKAFRFPIVSAENAIVFSLDAKSTELDEVVVQTTRTNQNMSDIATRIEALPLEELDEKGTMRPGDIKMLLGESTGITVQPTSAVSGAANFRIQGLDSRYTELLKDGMPLYQGFSGGLSILQIAPLDLQQVEFIKGSASTLYGGGAIAGLVNLIGKTPGNDPETTFLLNGNSAKGTDASGFYSEKWKHIGTAIFGAYNYNGAYDPSSSGFSAIPKTNRVTINPKLFLYFDKDNSGWIGVNYTSENRFGGDMKVLEGQADSTHQYYERNVCNRFSTQLSFTHKINDNSRINIKNTIGYFDRNLSEPNAVFAGKQLSSFSELNYVNHQRITDWVLGTNLITDHFTTTIPVNKYNYNLTTVGLFGQNTIHCGKRVAIESGLRADYNTPAAFGTTNGIFMLPRVNGLFKINQNWSSRIGGGLGYKMPSLFNDQSEKEGYQKIDPLNIGSAKAEKSIGGNADINFKKTVGDWVININQLFFYTHVSNPLMLVVDSFVSESGYITTQGAETNIKVNLNEWNLYLGYTYTDTKQHFGGQATTQPLTAKNRFSFDLTYEIEDAFRAGIESFYTSPQLLNDGTTGKGFVTFGLLVQKMWQNFDVYINAENLTDQRQTRWGSIYTGSITNPVFKDIYTPLEGVVVNAGIKIKLTKDKD